MRLAQLARGAMVIFAILALGGHAAANNGPRHWIFFVDKGPRSQSVDLFKSRVAQAHLSPRALERRAKVLPAQALVDDKDLPLHRPYVEKLRELGIVPVVTSRWLNAVSAALDQGQLARVREFPFVKEVRLVGTRAVAPEPPCPEQMAGVPKSSVHRFDYGPSYQQNAMIRVPEVHDLGIDGTGVRIGMLDTGFRYQVSEAFRHLRVVAEFDFINSDSVTHNEEGQDVTKQEEHGTETLSVIGGFSPGRLIGPAFGAEFVLAKTEYIPTETAIEEDFWVAGIEWLEAMGVDVVSSSLGYLDWYTYEDMDGNTAVTTRAADIAVSRGVVVVNSAGNEGNGAWRYVIAPADGDSVIAVGAVDGNGVLASFSSRGPTADGRIKPDVVAMGVGVYMAGPVHATDFRLGSGTSFSCPLVAGVAALLLAARPYLTPAEVAEALRETADRAQSPGNDYGWGLIDAWAALLYHGPVFTPQPQVSFLSNDRIEVSLAVVAEPAMRADGLLAFWGWDPDSLDKFAPMAPAEKAHYFLVALPRPEGGDTLYLHFWARDSKGRVFVHPHEAPRSLFSLQPGDSTLRLIQVPGDSTAPPLPQVRETFALRPLYPNPFPSPGRPYTTVEIAIAEPAEVSLAIYDLLGRKVATIFEKRPLLPRVYRFSWHGKDDVGRVLPSGLYFCRVEAGGITRVVKVLKVR